MSGVQVIGLWHDITPGHGVYFGLEGDGSFGLYLSSNVERGPYDWGTYTLDGPVLILANAEDSACAGATGVWDTAVSEGGDQAYFTSPRTTAPSPLVRSTGRSSDMLPSWSEPSSSRRPSEPGSRMLPDTTEPVPRIGEEPPPVVGAYRSARFQWVLRISWRRV